MVTWLWGERCQGCGGNLFVQEQEYGEVVKKCLLCGRETLDKKPRKLMAIRGKVTV